MNRRKFLESIEYIASQIQEAIEESRTQALEEAARVADIWAENVVHPEVSRGIAAAIRALKCPHNTR